MVNLGDTFLNLNPGSPQHLWVVASNRTEDHRYVIFNLTTKRPGCDLSCEVQTGEHPFVTRDSVVAYERGQLVAITTIRRMQDLGFYQAMEPVSLHLLRRIQEGALISEHTLNKLRDLIRLSLRRHS